MDIIYRQLEYTNRRFSTISHKTPFDSGTINDFIIRYLVVLKERKMYDLAVTDLIISELTKEIDFF